MNEANEFYENMRSRHETVLSWREGSNEDSGAPPKLGTSPGSSRPTSGSGKGLGHPETQSAILKNGALSPASKRMDLTPNG